MATLQFYSDDKTVRIFPLSDQSNPYVFNLDPDKKDLTCKKIEKLLRLIGVKQKISWEKTAWGYQCNLKKVGAS